MTDKRRIYATVYLSEIERAALEDVDVRTDYERTFERDISRSERIRRVLALALLKKRSTE